MSTAVRDAIQPGSAVDRYQIVGLLSAGGMGEVYRAVDPALERELVLKILSNEAVYRTELLERFIREARAASALNHPNIVTIYEIGEADGRHFIAMELVRGRTLRDIAKESVPVRTVARIGAQAARALAVAHAAGIVHRDIKPENIMMRDDGYVKVLDFGIARLSQHATDDHEISRLTAPGMVVGTMRYMSPEQATAAEVGPTSDIFSLGIVLYELATGRHPFHASSDIAMLSAIILREPQPASQLNPRIPPELDALLLRMLAKEPALRPAAGEVETALGTLRDPESAEQRAMPAAPAPGSPEIVGREPERIALRDAVAAASAGRALMMCVSGEAGIGKTTLVETFTRELPRSSIAVARGRCSERLAGAEAYLPILDALEELLRSDRTGIVSVALDNHAPSWRKQVAQISESPTTSSGAATASQERLKRELAAFVEEITSIRTLVLFLDDVHWADTSTVDLLGYLLARLEHDRLLVIATFRPSELQLARHPFLTLKLDLQSHGVARELPLSFLTLDEIQSYLDAKFPRNDFPRDIASVVHSRTEGNPLFVSDVLEYLRLKGVITQTDSKWTISGSLPDLKQDLPESVRSMVQRKISRLDDADRQLLVAAAVQGHSFDSAVVARALGRTAVDVEDRLEFLDRVHTFVNRRDEHELPDGTLTTRYRFVHVLYQNALNDSLAGARRAEQSRKVAEALLSFNEKSPGPVAGELGFLFEQARDAARAAEFYTLAARQAARVFANGEAAQLARRGLAALVRAERTAADDPRELTLQVILGTSLSATQGYAAPDVRTAMARARELAEKLGELPQLAPVIWGLFAHHLVAGEMTDAQRWAEQLLRIATAANDPLMLVGAHSAMAFGLFYAGLLPEVLEHCEKAASYYEPDKRPTYHAMYRMDPGVFIFSESARTSCLVGFPDSALQARDKALKLGSESPDPRSAAFAFLFASVLHELRREGPKALHYATLSIGVCDEHGIGQERAWAMAIRGWATAAGGKVDEGVSEIETAIAVQRRSHAVLGFTLALRQLAETYMWQGSLDKARAAVEEGLTISLQYNERASLHELHRILGETFRALRRMRGGNAAPDGDELFARAESEFREAIAEARRQSARLVELRAAAGLGRLLEEKGRGEEMREEVARLRDSFTEGRDLEDIRLANEFLERVSLSAARSSPALVTPH